MMRSHPNIPTHASMSRTSCLLALCAGCAAFTPSPPLGVLTGIALRKSSAPTPGLRSASSITATAAAPLDGPAFGTRVFDRMSSSAEVAVSKIFPAGAGWQTASLIAGNVGFASNSLAFFLTVGLGDLLGVFIGHTLFQLLKKKATGDASMKMTPQVQVATLLGGAAFFSGSMWQVALNAMLKLGLDFNGAFVGVGIACTWAFFAGLRVWRRLLSPNMAAVERKNYPNLKADVQLSIAIGAATAFFVGTDVSFGATNWLASIVGITAQMSDVVGVCVAGLSTSLGFMAAQLAMAVALPANKCWIDPAPKFSTK
jgi:hypothetical protein